MGSYVFRWNKTAEEVSIRGSFNNWDQSIQLKKSSGGFEKQIDIPTINKKIYYKFIVDGNWVTDPNMPTENDSSGNANNVLSPEDIDKIPAGGRSGFGLHDSPNTVGNIISGIGPGSSTASRAGDVPLTKDVQSTSTTEATGDVAHTDEKMPGAFPEPTPLNEGTYTPIDLFPGDMVPDYATYYSGTRPSRSSGNDSSLARDPNEQSFAVNPLPATSGYGNPMKLEPGQPVPPSSDVTSNDLQSNVTTDKESYEKSGSAPFSSLGGAGAGLTGMAAAGAAGVAGLFGYGSTKSSNTTIPESSLPMGEGTKDVEKDENPTIRSAAGQDTSASALAGQVPLEPRGVPQVVQESQQTANVEPEASQSSAAVSEKRDVEDELKRKVPEEEPISRTQAMSPSDAASGVPQVVQTSQQKASADPEASQSSEAVTEKTAMENELRQVVPKEQPTSESTEAADGVPQVVQESQQAAGVALEASQSSEAVTEKRGVEEELKQKVPEEQPASENKGIIAGAVGGATAVGAAAIGGLAYASQKAGVPQSIQDKISSMNTTTSKPADDVPRPVADSYERSSQSPEAAANSEAVSEKKDVEKELLQDVKTTDATGEPAPTMTAAHITEAPGSGSGVVPPTHSTTSELAGGISDGNITGASTTRFADRSTSESGGFLAGAAGGAGLGAGALGLGSGAFSSSGTGARSIDPTSTSGNHLTGTSASAQEEPSYTSSSKETSSGSEGVLSRDAAVYAPPAALATSAVPSSFGIDSRSLNPTNNGPSGASAGILNERSTLSSAEQASSGVRGATSDSGSVLAGTNDGAGLGSSAPASASDAVSSDSGTGLRSADPSATLPGTSTNALNQPSSTTPAVETSSGSTGLLAGAGTAGGLGAGALAYGSGAFSSTSGASSRSAEPASSGLMGQSSSTATRDQLVSSDLGSSSYESGSRITDPSTIPSTESNSMIADADTMPAIALANGDAVQPSQPNIGSQDSTSSTPLASSGVPPHTIGTGPSYMMATGPSSVESSTVPGASSTTGAATGTTGTYPASIPATELSSRNSPIVSGTSGTTSDAYDSSMPKTVHSSTETPAASGIFGPTTYGTTGTTTSSSEMPVTSDASETTGHHYGRDAALVGGTGAIGAAGAAAYMGYNSRQNAVGTTGTDMATSSGAPSSSAASSGLTSSARDTVTGSDLNSSSANPSSSVAGSGLGSSDRDTVSGSNLTSVGAVTSSPSAALPAGAFVDDTPISVRSATSGAAPSMGTTNASQISNQSTSNVLSGAESSTPIAGAYNGLSSSTRDLLPSAVSSAPVAGAYSSTTGNGLGPSTGNVISGTEPSTPVAGAYSSTADGGTVSSARDTLSGPSARDQQAYSTSGATGAMAASSGSNQTNAVDRSVFTGTSSGSGFIAQPATSTASSKPLAAPEDPSSRTSAPATDIAARVFGAGTMPASTSATGASPSLLAGTAGAIGGAGLGAGAVALGGGVHSSTTTAAVPASSATSASPMTSSSDAARSTSRGVFDRDPISAVGSSAPAITSTAPTLEPRTAESAFADDPISAADDSAVKSRTVMAPASTSAAITAQSSLAPTIGATSGATSGATTTGVSSLVGGGAAGLVGGGAAGLVGGGAGASATSSGTKSGVTSGLDPSGFNTSGLNASAKDPAKSAATAAMAKENVVPAKSGANTNTSRTGPAMTTPPKATSGAGGLTSSFGESSKQKAVSRDVSPHSHGGAGPSTTTDVASSSAATKQGPSTPQKGSKTTTTGTPASAASASTSGTPKSEKRRSRLGTWFKEHVTERKSSKK